MSAHPLNETALEKAIEAVRSRNMFTLDGAVAEGIRAYFSALHAAGYRLVGPGELDRETIERCIAVANDHDGMPCRAAPGWSLDQAAHYQYGQQDATSSVAAALRSLQGGE